MEKERRELVVVLVLAMREGGGETVVEWCGVVLECVVERYGEREARARRAGCFDVCSWMRTQEGRGGGRPEQQEEGVGEQEAGHRCWWCGV